MNKVIDKSMYIEKDKILADNNLLSKAERLKCLNKHKEAISFYLNSLLLDRKNPKIYLGLGLCYKKCGKTDKAIEALNKAADLDNESFEVFFELGCCYLSIEEPCLAIKNFVRSIQIQPNNVEAIYHLGLAHQLAQEDDMAIMIYQKLIENSPKYQKAYLEKAKILMRMGLYRKALGDLNSALKLTPANSGIYSAIGFCLDKLGKTQEAKRYYVKYLKAKPNAHNTNEIITRIGQIKTSKSTNLKFSIV